MRSVILLLASVMAMSGAVPIVYFTDLISGPNSGGENGNGTILTVYGRNFGGTRGSSTVTVGGGAVAAYLLWGGHSAPVTAFAQLETISVAIGASAATGVVVVTTPAGASTCEDSHNSCTFTVRAGNIRCVAVGGNDGSAGTFPSSCWASIPQAAHTLASGDIAYIKTGVAANGQDNFNSNVLIQNSCTAPAPCALVAYPGATVTVGGVSDQNRGVRIDGNNWVIAGLTIRAVFEGTQNNGNNGVRYISNDDSCPNGDGQDACNHAESGAQNIVYYGNYFHDTGTGCSSDCKEYHTFYMSTNSIHIWVGFNEIAPNPSQTSKGGCRAVQFYSTGGTDQFDLHVFNNYIHDSICDGLNFATVDADLGVVEVYNNILFRLGTGPTPTTSDSNYACLNIDSISGMTTNPVLFFNNSLYDCGAKGVGEGDAGAITVCGGSACSTDRVKLYNNIIQVKSGEGYFSANVVNHASCANFTGSTNNIMTGLAANSFCTGSFANSSNANPSYTSLTTPDFHLTTSGSPANGAGTPTGASTYDYAGLVRPNPPAMGAFEFAAGVLPPPVSARHRSKVIF